MTSPEIEATLKERIYKNTSTHERPNIMVDHEFKRTAVNSSAVEREMGITTKNRGKKNKHKSTRQQNQGTSDNPTRGPKEASEVDLERVNLFDPQAKGKREKMPVRRNKYKDEVFVKQSHGTSIAAKDDEEAGVASTMSISQQQKSYSSNTNSEQLSKLNSYSGDFPPLQHAEKQNISNSQNSAVERTQNVIEEKRGARKKKRKKKKKSGSEEPTSSDSEQEMGSTRPSTKSEPRPSECPAVKEAVGQSKPRALTGLKLKGKYLILDHIYL